MSAPSLIQRSPRQCTRGGSSMAPIAGLLDAARVLQGLPGLRGLDDAVQARGGAT